MTPENDVLLLKQFPFSLRGIAYDWYLMLHGITILKWVGMEERFLQEQLTHRHNPEILRNLAVNDIRRINNIAGATF